MTIDNGDGLTNFHAHNPGCGFYDETAVFHGVQAGIGGFFVYNPGGMLSGLDARLLPVFKKDMRNLGR